jgi:hypothetical protein
VVTWERDWPLLTGWKRWLVVAGAVHASFTDLALLAEWNERPVFQPPGEPESCLGLC